MFSRWSTNNIIKRGIVTVQIVWMGKVIKVTSLSTTQLTLHYITRTRYTDTITHSEGTLNHSPRLRDILSYHHTSSIDTIPQLLSTHSQILLHRCLISIGDIACIAKYCSLKHILL
jgi:hypothetical protein